MLWGPGLIINASIISKAELKRMSQPCMLDLRGKWCFEG